MAAIGKAGRQPSARESKYTHKILEIRMVESHMPEHIEDLQQRSAELAKRIELVRSYL